MYQPASEVEELEAQLKAMSQAAAQAIERASHLEMELDRRGHRRMSSSNSSITSHSSSSSTTEERLLVLENALDAICRARVELARPYNYQYL